jgi:ankyrin repeat protein
VEKGEMYTLRFFLDVMKGNVDASDKSDQTILSHAAQNGHVDLTKYLLSRGALPTIPDKEGRTAVYWAAREGKLKALKALVRANATVTKMDVAVSREMGWYKVDEYLANHVQSSNPRDGDPM